MDSERVKSLKILFFIIFIIDDFNSNLRITRQLNKSDNI